MIDEEHRFFVSNLLNGFRFNNIPLSLMFDRILDIHRCEWPDELDAFLLNLKNLFVDPCFPPSNTTDIISVFNKYDKIVEKNWSK